MTERPDAANPATGSVRYVDPEVLNKNPAFSNVVVVEGPVRTVYVGGQNAVDASGNIVGKKATSPPRRSRCSLTCGRRSPQVAQSPST
jgi:hypothetical protein